jgi:hypothetical protein
MNQQAIDSIRRAWTLLCHAQEIIGSVRAPINAETQAHVAGLMTAASALETHLGLQIIDEHPKPRRCVLLSPVPCKVEEIDGVLREVTFDNHGGDFRFVFVGDYLITVTITAMTTISVCGEVTVWEVAHP